MSIALLYLLLLRASLTSFAGLASLPMLQDSLVHQRHVLTEEQLNQAVVITRSTPGAVGVYIVSVGYYVAGLPGAFVGWLAMITPALLIIPLLHHASRSQTHPRVKSALQALVIASAGLLVAAAIPLGQDALTSGVTVAIACASMALLLMTRIDTLWIIVGAAIVSMSASSICLLGRI
jgi:chromate transporter